MAKLYLRKRKDAYIEVDPQIIRWRKSKPQIVFERKPKLGRPKRKKANVKFKDFF